MKTTQRVGRPIEKIGRIKIGLSIDGESNIILDNLAKRTGKTKSRLFEDAIKLMKKIILKKKKNKTQFILK